MKNILILVFVFTTQIITSQNYKELTPEEKEGDLNYLIEVLKNNYPYFDRYECTYGKSWLSQKDLFLEKVRNSKDNENYLVQLDSIIKSLHDKEVDLAPTYYWDHFRTKYGEAYFMNPGYTPWVNTLNQSQKKMPYWSNLLKKENIKTTVNNNDLQYKDSLVRSLEIGIMRIPSFDTECITNTFQRINEFLYLVNNYDYLIIDIQGNKGGSSSFWMDGIVSRLIQTPVNFNRHFAIKKGTINYLFFSRYLNNISGIIPSSLPSLPLEFSEQNFKLVEETTTIQPFLPIPFKGEIILLTDSAVFSAADEFASFAKSSSWATIAGETTGGGGIGSDAVLVRLPASGIIVRYPALAGLNPNGSLHREYKTTPNIEIKGSNADERLNNLINKLNNRHLLMVQLSENKSPYE